MATPRLAIRSADFDSSPVTATALERLAAGDMEAGSRLLREASERYPDDAPVAHFLGMVHFDAGRPAEALPWLARAAELAPGISAYAYNEGAAALLAGRFEDALSAFIRSLNGDELLPDAHRWAWSALSGCGTFDSALRCMREALRRQDPAAVVPEVDGRISVDTVTLCAVDCVDADLAARALRRSMARCRFGSVKLLTSRPFLAQDIETVPIDPIDSLEAYSRFVMKSLARYVATEHALVVQWDGYVVNAGAWTGEFLDCDFIGATWDPYLVQSWGCPATHNVGNGGFSLRSIRLLEAASDPVLVATHPEDEHMCRTYRGYLEQRHGIRFAPGALADRFSFEANRPEATPFGFHGSFNLCCFEADPYWMRFGFLGLVE